RLACQRANAKQNRNASDDGASVGQRMCRHGDSPALESAQYESTIARDGEQLTACSLLVDVGAKVTTLPRRSRILCVAFNVKHECTFNRSVNIQEALQGNRLAGEEWLSNWRAGKFARLKEPSRVILNGGVSTARGSAMETSSD